MGIGVTVWTAANNKWKQNISSLTASNATSIGTGNLGPNGTDIAYPVKISDTRWLWLLGDTWWPTAAGQARPSGRLVGNVVALQVGQDFPSSTLTFHCGPRPGTDPSVTSNTNPWPFFAHKGHPALYGPTEMTQPGCIRYPMCGIRLSTNMLLIVGMTHMSNVNFNPDSSTTAWQDIGGAAGTTPVGPWAVILHGNLDGANPNTWAHQEVRVDLPFSPAGFNQRMSFHFGPGLDIVDDKLIVWCQGPWDQSGHWSVCRYPLKEVKQGLMLAPEWWVGGDRWVPDRENAQRRLRVTPNEVRCEQGGSMFRREDGRYQLLVVPQPFFPDPGAAERKQGAAQIKFAIGDSPGEAYANLKTLYELPILEDDFDFFYSAYLALGQEWTGNFDPTRQVISYSTHNFNGLAAFTNTRTYWPRMLQVVGM